MGHSCTSTRRSWSGGGGREADEVGWSRKVMEMGQGKDKDEKGKKGGRTMTRTDPPHGMFPSSHHWQSQKTKMIFCNSLGCTAGGARKPGSLTIQIELDR